MKQKNTDPQVKASPMREKKEKKETEEKKMSVYGKEMMRMGDLSEIDCGCCTC